MTKDFSAECSGSEEASSPSEEEVHIAIFIGGFLSPRNWISYPPDLVPKNLRIITVNPSPVGSLHDRVCQIFYELKGGKVNFGEEHSRYHGHAQYGRDYKEGKYQKWSSSKPIYVIGHSLGNIFYSSQIA
jgi:hypothetical protein